MFKHQYLPQIWVEFVEYHTSNEFFLEVVDLFGDSIRHSYQTLKKGLGT